MNSLAGHFSKATLLLLRGKTAAAKDIVARDWAAIIRSAPTTRGTRDALLTYAESMLRGLSRSNISMHYKLMLNYVAFETRSGVAVKLISAALSASMRLNGVFKAVKAPLNKLTKTVVGSAASQANVVRLHTLFILFL